MQRLLARVVLLVLACDLTVVAVRTFVEPVERSASVPTTTSTTDLGIGGTRPAPGQTLVAGRVTAVRAEAQAVGSVPVPFTIDAPRGSGSAVVREAVIDGQRMTIVWDSGRPLPITGTGGGLDLGPATVELGADGVRYPLDGDPRGFLAGEYSTSATVAVGRGGLAAPRDGVRFTADARTTLTTSGGAAITLPARAVHLTGPGKVDASGALVLGDETGSRRASHLTFGPGPFELDATPAGRAYQLRGTLQGPVTST